MSLSTIQCSLWFRGTLIALLFSVFLSLTGRAQSGGSFTFTQTVIAGGGGSSTGGNFKLEGTIGQPDTGTRSGGNFSWQGGFWGAQAVGNCPLITLAPATLPSGTPGVQYSQTITATPSGTYTFTVTNGTLPTGITLTTAGLLSGTTAQLGSFPITITAQDAMGCVGSSNFTLVIGNPVPSITSLTPASVLVGAAAFTLTVNGANFVNGAVVKWNGMDRTTTFVSSTQLQASILAADLVSTGNVGITVSNPGPGGGLSNEALFTVLSLTSYEADVAPRPNGNGTVSIADWTQVGRFVVGLDMPASGSEFQRTDVAPKAMFGDGKITVADWVQAGRYAAGLDAVVIAGGPTMPAPLPPLAQATASPQSELARVVRVNNANFQRGQVGVLSLEIEAQGNESGLGFTLNYDARRLSFVDAKLGKDAGGAVVVVNATQSAHGKIGIALALPPGQVLRAGTHALLTLRFIPAGGESDIATTVSFGDQLLPRDLADLNGMAVPEVSYANATVNITGRTAATVSAASYIGGELAADAIASAFGTKLATMTLGASKSPLPTTLGGSAVSVKDSQGVERAAPLFFVSPDQINYQIPAETADGIATATITNGAGEVTRGLVSIAPVAPGLFAADATGKGWAAGSVLYVNADQSRLERPLVSFDAATNTVVAVPIDLSAAGGQAYLTLYGTGLRHRSAMANVTAKIGGVDAQVEYAGAQPGYAGLDQINIRLPRNLRGRGAVDIAITVDGKAANVLRIQIQ